MFGYPICRSRSTLVDLLCVLVINCGVLLIFLLLEGEGSGTDRNGSEESKRRSEGSYKTSIKKHRARAVFKEGAIYTSKGLILSQLNSTPTPGVSGATAR